MHYLFLFQHVRQSRALTTALWVRTSQPISSQDAKRVSAKVSICSFILNDVVNRRSYLTVTYLSVSIVFIYLVLYLKKKIL